MLRGEREREREKAYSFLPLFANAKLEIGVSYSNALSRLKSNDSVAARHCGTTMFKLANDITFGAKKLSVCVHVNDRQKLAGKERDERERKRAEERLQG